MRTGLPRPQDKALVARLALWKDVAMAWRLYVCAMAAGLAAASCRIAETGNREDVPKVCSDAVTMSPSYASADTEAYPFLWPADPDISWPTQFGLFGLAAVADTPGNHKGQGLEFSYRVLFELGGFAFIPSAGMRWKSQDLIDYYYGVRPRETGVGRPAYEGENSLDPFVRLAMRRRLTDRWSLLAVAQYEWLDDQIRSSPIVDADYDASFMLGMLYSW